MSPPRKKKPSRKDRQQKTQYSYILGESLHLKRLEHTTAQETDRPNDLQAGGHRSNNEVHKGLTVYWNSLSTREQDVTILICKGFADAEIAAQLNLSVATVRSYLQRVFLKTHTRNRKQLIVRFAGFDLPRDIPPDI